MISLNAIQRRDLRARAHGLNPVVSISQNGLTESVLKEIDASLKSHELIKVKILESCMLERSDAATQLAEACNAEVAQILGRTFLLYKQAKEPRIELPKEKKK